VHGTMDVNRCDEELGIALDHCVRLNADRRDTVQAKYRAYISDWLLHVHTASKTCTPLDDNTVLICKSKGKAGFFDFVKISKKYSLARIG
jgi:hypothetical protein